jgi:hypothetical protein
LPLAIRLERRSRGIPEKMPWLAVRKFQFGDDSVFLEILNDSFGPLEYPRSVLGSILCLTYSIDVLGIVVSRVSLRELPALPD